MEMKSLGITGNIGTGKSSVLNILKNSVQGVKFRNVLEMNF